MGFILTLTSFCHLACLFAFFVTSSKATKFRAHQKRKLEANFKDGGQRNWIQVLCNGGMATQLALLYLLDVGCVEQPIHFDKHYRSSWLSIGILGIFLYSLYSITTYKRISKLLIVLNYHLGAFACCNGDTWASEIGSVVGSKDPFLITSFKRVPKGENTRMQRSIK